jgi:hypothetical protein
MGPLRGDCVPAVPLSLWVLHTRYCWLDGNGVYMINVSPWGATGTGAGPCRVLGSRVCTITIAAPQQGHRMGGRCLDAAVFSYRWLRSSHC